MKMKPHNIISAVVLFVLIWSCFGLNLGMIGHSFMSESHLGHGGEVSTMHDCCVIATEGQDAGSAPMMDHHATASVIIQTVDFSLLLAILLLVFIVPLPRLFVSAHAHISLYLKRWREQYLYFALHFQKLFSKGILHPKTW